MTSTGDPADPQQFLDDYLELVDVDSRKQLFFDDHVILEMVGARRVFHRPRKLPENPLMRPQNPEENNVVNPAAIFYDPRIGRFRLWYSCERTDETQSVAYAESDDGIAWERRASTADGRPSGDFSPFNKVWFKRPDRPDEMGERVRDPGAIEHHPWEQDPQRRYKMTQRRGLPIAFSADGYTWTAQPNMVPSYRGTKDENTFFYDPDGRRWLACLRHNPPHVGWTHLRFIIIDESRDMVTWKPTTGLLYPDRVDGFGTSFFFCRAYAYEGIYVALPATFVSAEHHDERLRDQIQTELAYSRDGLSWHRPPLRPFIAIAGEDAWDSHMAGPSLMVVHDETIYFHYLGSTAQHGVPYAGEETSMGAALLRVDGFVSLEVEAPAARPAVVLTKVLRFQGDRLYLNADARGGEIRVDLLIGGYPGDIDGDNMNQPWKHQPPPVDPITTDSTRHIVCWQGQSDVGKVQGVPIRLRFTLTGNAKLYAFQFAHHDASQDGVRPS